MRVQLIQMQICMGPYAVIKMSITYLLEKNEEF